MCDYILTGLQGLMGVIAGAYGSHGLKGKVTPEQRDAFLTASQYQLFSSAAMLALISARQGMLPKSRSHMLMTAAFWLMACGTNLFSTTIYWIVLGYRKFWPIPLTPLGGLVLMAAWLCVSLSGLLKESKLKQSL